MNLQKTALAAASLLAALSFVPAAAQTKAAEPDYTLAFNVGATTDYRYRGLSQTRLKPAVQGGLDFSHKSGFYLGAWGSNIKWVKDGGGDGSLELDLYGGYKGSITGDLAYDVGVLAYVYPSNKLAVSANTTELYGALTYGPVTAKYSHAATNLFGFAKSKNSSYFDLNATFDMGNGWSVVPHIGYQKVSNNKTFSYSDYSVTVNKDLGGGFVVSGALVGTDTKDYVSPAGKNLGKTGLVVTAKYNF